MPSTRKWAGFAAVVTVAGAMVPTAFANQPMASPAQILLPDQRLCTYVGPEPRQRDLGDPITYLCNDGRGLRGEVRLDGTYMTVDREGRENFDRDAIIESEDIRFLIAEIVLADGTLCRHAGEGATLAFDGKRLNYTCGRSAGLMGDITMQAGGMFEVEKATLHGTELVSSEVVPIRRLGAASR
ncbi:MAG: hypothetical protein ACHWZW_17460 [Spirulina sp.]